MVTAGDELPALQQGQSGQMPSANCFRKSMLAMRIVAVLIG